MGILGKQICGRLEPRLLYLLINLNFLKSRGRVVKYAVTMLPEIPGIVEEFLNQGGEPLSARCA